MRTGIEMMRDWEASTECKKQGIRHKFQLSGEPFNIFWDGSKPSHSHIERLQTVVCKRCGFEKWMPVMERIK